MKILGLLVGVVIIALGWIVVPGALLFLLGVPRGTAIAFVALWIMLNLVVYGHNRRLSELESKNKPTV